MNRKLSKPLLQLAFSLLAIATGLCIFALIKKEVDYPTGVIIINFLSIAVAFMYFFKGYSKDAAKYFRIVMLFDAATYILDCLYLAVKPIQVDIDAGIYASLALILVMYGNTLIIAIGKDLGKKASLLIYGCNTLLYVANFVSSLGGNISELTVALIWLILSLVGLIMIEAKYMDKENRNTK